jgi:hypothetical protein
MEQWVWGLLFQGPVKEEIFTPGNIIQLVVYIVLLTTFFISLRERVNELKEGRKEDRQEMDKIRKQLSDHCEDDDQHINPKVWAELSRRLERIERKVDNLGSNRS